MMRYRARKSGVAMLVAALLLPLPAATAKGNAKLDLIKEEAAAVVKGTGAWVSLTWTARDGDIEDVRMTVTSRTEGVSVSYPDNTGDHVSFWGDDDLRSGEIDYTAFHLDVGEQTTDNKAKLRVEVEMTADGKRESRQFEVRVPLVDYTGTNIEQVTDAVAGVPSGDVRWVEVAFTGLAPSTTNLATVVSATGVGIVYPGEGAQTSLHHDAQLDYGETDVVRFVVDASGADPGLYQLELDTTFTGGSLVGTVTVEILPST